MAVFAITQITSVGVFHDQIYQLVTTARKCAFTQVMRELPRLGFVYPHQRCFNQEPSVHA
jgi:hypothetical protein